MSVSVPASISARHHSIRASFLQVARRGILACPLLFAWRADKELKLTMPPTIWRSPNCRTL